MLHPVPVDLIIFYTVCFFIAAPLSLFLHFFSLCGVFVALVFLSGLSRLSCAVCFLAFLLLFVLVFFLRYTIGESGMSPSPVLFLGS